MSTPPPTFSTLVDQMQRLIESGTFTLEAVQGIAALRQQADRMLVANDELQASFDKLRKDYAELRAQYDEAKQRLFDIEKRELAVREFEIQKAVDTKVLELTIQNKTEYHNLLAAALRNTSIRASMFGNTPVVVGGYPQQTPMNSMTDTEPV